MIAASGNSITNCCCADCGKYTHIHPSNHRHSLFAHGWTAGTVLYRYGDSFGGLAGSRIIQAGVLNDTSVLGALRPDLEMFVKDRVPWVPAIEGAAQYEGMPPPPPPPGT